MKKIFLLVVLFPSLGIAARFGGLRSNDQVMMSTDSASTAYIQNTLTPTTTTQSFSVQIATVTDSLNVLGPDGILYADTLENSINGFGLSIQGLNGVNNGDPGDDINMIGGSCVGGNANGGGIVVTGGTPCGTGQAGGVTFSAGVPVNANGKSITFNASSGVGTNKNGGDISFTAGLATGAGLDGGYKFSGSAGGTGKLDFSALGSNRTFNFPDTPGRVPITPTMTLGSIPFFSGSNTQLQDNSQFFWDDTNFRLGVGTNTPAAQIHISSSARSEIRIQGTTSDAFVTWYDTSTNLIGFINNLGSYPHRQIAYQGADVTGKFANDDNWFMARFNGGSNKFSFGDTGVVGWLQTTHNMYLRANATTNAYVGPDLTIASGLVALGHSQPQSTKLDIAGTGTTSSTFGIRTRSKSAELITNPNDRGFAGAGNWTGTNWAVSGGVFQHTTGDTTAASLTAANMTAGTIVSGDRYQIIYAVSGMTAGTLTAKLGTGSAAEGVAGANGSYTQYFTASGNDVDLTFTPTTDFDGALDNVSLIHFATLFTLDDAGALTTVGSLNVNSTNATAPQVLIRGAVGQTSGVQILDVQTSTAATSDLLAVDKNGLVQIPNTLRTNNGLAGTSYVEMTSNGFTKVTGGTTLGSMAQGSTYGGSADLAFDGVAGRPMGIGKTSAVEIGTMTVTSAAFVPVIIQGASSQSGDLVDIKNSAATTLSLFDSAGNLRIGSGQTTGEISIGAQAPNTNFGIQIDRAIASPVTSNIDGITGEMMVTGGTPNITNLAGVSFSGRANHTGGTIANVYGGVFQARVTNSGNVTNANGVHITSTGLGSTGTPTHNYGLYIEDQTAGSTDNYAVYTSTGLVRFGDLVSVLVSSSTKLAKVGGTIFDHYVDSGTTGTSETDLYKDALSSNTFNRNGDKVTTTYAGTFVNSATATRQIKVYFSTTTIFDSGAISVSAASEWTINVLMIRVSDSAVRCSVWMNLTGASTSAYDNYIQVGGLTFTNDNTLKITGTSAGVGAATNDIVASMATGEWKPAQ